MWSVKPKFHKNTTNNKKSKYNFGYLNGVNDFSSVTLKKKNGLQGSVTNNLVEKCRERGQEETVNPCNSFTRKRGKYSVSDTVVERPNYIVLTNLTEYYNGK